MDIFRKLHNNPGFEHLVENIIGFMDIDKAMEIMIENDELSESERKIFGVCGALEASALGSR